MTSEQMTTYKLADGEAVAGEFGWVTDLDYFEEYEEPVELVREVWHRTTVETFWQMPDRLYSCTRDLDCDEDAVAWEQIDGTWFQVCEAHRMPS